MCRVQQLFWCIASCSTGYRSRFASAPEGRCWRLVISMQGSLGFRRFHPRIIMIAKVTIDALTSCPPDLWVLPK